jgi:hypothetical protein
MVSGTKNPHDPMTRSKVHALLVGDSGYREFKRCLRAICKDSQCQYVSFDQLDNFTDHSGTADVIVMFQSRPGQITNETFQRVTALAPLVPSVLVVGSWCEGELRSGDPPDSITRYYWHQFEPHWREFVETFVVDRPSEWHLPQTMTHADRLLCRDPVKASTPISIGVDARHNWTAEAIIDACSSIGFSATSVNGGRLSQHDYDVLIVDDDGFGHPHSPMSNVQAAKPKVILMSYPRWDFVSKLPASVVVISKPHGLVELKHAVESLVCGDSKSTIA